LHRRALRSGIDDLIAAALELIIRFNSRPLGNTPMEVPNRPCCAGRAQNSNAQKGRREGGEEEGTRKSERRSDKGEGLERRALPAAPAGADGLAMRGRAAPGRR